MAEMSKRLKCLPNSRHFTRKLSDRFLLTESVRNSTAATLNHESTLLALPFEVQLLIFESLYHAPSQVSLALTCKRFAEVASRTNIHRAEFSPRYAGKLPKDAFDIPDLMRQLSTWMPADTRLCDHCLTNRPTDGGYWEGVEGCAGSKLWVKKVGWMYEGGWQKQVHNICPYCHVTCCLSDYVECDGCRAAGRWGDIDFGSLGASHRQRTEEALRNGVFAT